MDQAFDMAELKDLCADLNVDIENLAGTVKKEKILELIKYLERYNRLQDLLTLLDESRPDFDLTSVQSSHKKRYLGTAVVLIFLLLVGAAWAAVNTGQFCPVHAETDHETIVQIIKTESLAVNEGNLELIEEIFAPDAYIKQTEKADGAVVEWLDPISHYGPLFENTRFFGARHTDIEGAVTGSFARFTSGSEGRYLTGDRRGEYQNAADNPAEAEVWTLEKNFWGCWQITRFEFH
jgi:hypothetical protein